MFPEMPDLPEGCRQYIEAVCRQCDKPEAALRLYPALVNQRGKPQNQTLAIVVSASRRPPTVTKTIKCENGPDHMATYPNPDFDYQDRVIVATLERGMDLCLDRDCFHNAMDEIWRLAKKRTLKLWAESD